MRLLPAYLRLILRRSGTKNLCASALFSLCILMVTLLPMIKRFISILPPGEYFDHYLGSFQIILLCISFLGLLIFLWRSMESGMPEYGIMLSLGATRKDIIHMVLIQTATSGLITLVFGLLAGGFLSLLILDLVIISTNFQFMIEVETKGVLALVSVVFVSIVFMGIKFYQKVIGKTTAALLSQDN